MTAAYGIPAGLLALFYLHGGALGPVLPPLTGIAPWLAAVAAAGFVLLQLGAIRIHCG